MSTIVIMPGGFHPFHAGHMALYNSALKAFPGASMYIAATNDTKTRPFPFSVKEKLAKVAGVPSGQFVQVKSPFQPREITSQFDPQQDVLIFVRSEKDKNESPTPGGTKQDGSPNYFQPYAKGQLQPFGKHAYMAYLPTVEFGPGLTSATEIRDAWTTLNEKRKTALVMSLYPATQKNTRLANVVVRLLDSVLGGAEPINHQSEITEGLTWDDTGKNLSIDDRLAIFAEYHSSSSRNICESNDSDLSDYFLKLGLLSNKPTPNEKTLMIPLVLMNNKVMQLRYPEEVTVVSIQENGYTVKLKDGSIDTFPSTKLSKILTTVTFFFNNSQSFDKFRTIMSLKFDHDFSDYEEYTGAEPMNEGQDLLQVPNNIANTVAELLNHKKPDLFTRYGPEYVMNIIQDVCADAPTKSITELAVETLERLKIKTKKKVKAISENMVIGCCPNESQGLPMPGTYEQEYDMYKTNGGQRRTIALTTEDSDAGDREVQAMLKFAQQHYPEASKQEAFMKFVLHALKHSEQDDNRQDQELQNLDHEVDNIEHEVDDIESKVVNVAESADYLEEK